MREVQSTLPNQDSKELYDDISTSSVEKYGFLLTLLSRENT